MSLKMTDRPPARHPLGGWNLKMLNGDEPVSVHVTEAALGGANIWSCRGTLADIANQKFSNGEVDRQGAITIGPEDMPPH